MKKDIEVKTLKELVGEDGIKLLLKHLKDKYNIDKDKKVSS